MFDSKIRRVAEEEIGKQAAGLSAFKSTGNAMRDGFRRMIEKKLREKIEVELKKKQEQDSVYAREVEARTAFRMKQVEEERK